VANKETAPPGGAAPATPKPKTRATRGSASVYNRGSKHRPNWWIRFWDPTTRRQHREPATGAVLKSQAEALLAQRKQALFEGTFFPEKKSRSLTVNRPARRTFRCALAVLLKPIDWW
jgi:hypothetical protein